LDAWKGHRELLRALAQLTALPRWVCWVAGAPQRPAELEYYRELLGLVEAYGLTGRVHFIGHRDDMATVLSACDIYCQPNETPEPFGMVFVEAMFAGKPVVGSKSGGTLDIVTPECGILCSANDGSLSSALERLVVDAGARGELSANAPKRARLLCGAGSFSVRLQQILERSLGSA
ncbi:MAG TPA: glycosyltransferase, partial [Polyangiaceae bacterium]